MRGSSFLRTLPASGEGRAIIAREAAVLEAVRSGLALPIAWRAVRCEMPGHKGIVYVASDTLRFGEPGPNLDATDWDWVRIAVTAATAQQIADALGVLLPTDRIADLAHAQADVRLTPHWQAPVTATTDAMLHHHADIEAERAGRDGLLSTIGKDWILGRELFPRPGSSVPMHPLGWDGAINYGWHTRGPATPSGPYIGQPGVILWQTKGCRHNRGHVDYSQWVPRFVHPRMQVDGTWMATADVMRSRELAALLTYDGPLPETRYPQRPSANMRTAAIASANSDSDTSALDGLLAPDGRGPGAALAHLEQQINTRFPYRGTGPLDGLGADGVLRITHDPSLNGSLRSSPDLERLKAAVLADRRTLRTEPTWDAARTRYLAIVVRPAPSFSRDPSSWDLTGVDGTILGAGVIGEGAPDDAGLEAVDTDAAGDSIAHEAQAGAAIGATVGTALEAVPVVGPLLHGVAAAVGAIGGAISGALRDTFHPTPVQAAAWLALFHIDPALVFSGVDTITASTGDRQHPAEEHAARLVRYLLLVSGFVRNGGELYNPNDIRNDNPYMARPDPRYPLTDPAHLRGIREHIVAKRPIRSEVRTRAQARFILKLLRATLGPSGVMGWSEARAHRRPLREALRGVRRLAGEFGPDNRLARLFGGEL